MTTPAKYLLFNQEQSKNLCIVMQIEGIDDLFGISGTFTEVKYGDAGVHYGDSGLVYGGLRSLTTLKPYIILDGGLSIGQRIEPEQGRGNVGTLTVSLIDYNGEVSLLIAPGITIDELLLKREVKIFLGFKQTSFPTDFLLVYRGYVTSIQCPPGLVRLQLSDATSKKRAPIFDTPTTNLTAGVDNVQTTIPVIDGSAFHQQILGPDGTYDPIVRTYINIDDEWMEYAATGYSAGTFTVSRGGSHSLGTTAASHDIDATVNNGVQLGGNTAGVNFITLALKILLSGWNGPCETGISVNSFVFTILSDPGLVTNSFTLNNLDAKQDLGLSIGDYFTISGASNPGNNISGKIIGFDDSVLSNQVILTNQIFTFENPTSAVVAFRSKYDTLPTTCGAMLRMRDVDVDQFEFIRDTYFTTSVGNMQFFFNEATDGKTLIDSQMMLPMGCYGISRYGRVSIAITKPPLPGGTLVELNWTNILNADKIMVTRAVNNRCFFNLISFEYDKDPASGNYGTIEYFDDLDSLNLYNVTSKLPIQADGLKSALGGGNIAQIRGAALLTRYKNIALLIELTVNWTAGSLLEVSDVVLVRDQGKLKIMNFSTGVRDLGVQLFEVIDRQYNIVDGTVTLKLMGGLNFDLNSRFGTYSPASIIGTGSTTTTLRITPSYGQPDLTAEMLKWEKFVGQVVHVHNSDYTLSGKAAIQGFSDTDSAAILMASALPFAATAGMIVDIDDYPTDTDPNTAAIYKLLYTHFSPSIAITSGISNTSFHVSSGNISKFVVGQKLIVRNSDWSTISPEVEVLMASGTTVTVKTSLGFTPTSAYTVEGVGFPDGTSFYRFS